jgi:mono/diheme cytochrome c family protein
MIRAAFHGFLFLVLLAASTLANELDDGRRIFRLGADGASTKACRSCHGGDGQGQSLEGVEVPSLDLNQYRKPDELLQLLNAGTAPDGREIAKVMPRYTLSIQEAQALGSYLRQLPSEETRGISNGKIMIGYFASSGKKADGFFSALSDELKRHSFYGRSVELVPVDLSADRTPSDIFVTLQNQQLAAWVGDSIDEQTDGLKEALASLGIPRLFPRDGLSGDENPDDVRGASASLADQLRVVIDTAAERNMPQVALVSDPPGVWLNKVSDTQTRKYSGQKWIRPKDKGFSSAAVGVQAVLGNSLAEADALPCAKTVITSTDNLALVLQSKTCTSDELVAVDPRPYRDTAATDDAARYGKIAGMVLASALRNAGRQLTRTKLMRALSAVKLRSKDWPALDYSKYSLTGTTELGLITVNATGNKVRFRAGLLPK